MIKSTSTLIVLYVLASLACARDWTGSYYVATSMDFCCVPLSEVTITDENNKITFVSRLEGRSACKGAGDTISQTVDKSGTSANMKVDNYDVTISEERDGSRAYLEYSYKTSGTLFG